MAGVSFDRAAGFYDATRALPGDVGTAVADMLASELAGAGPCLEIGVGTGRIALPLSARGVELVGADLSPAMLARLGANSGGRPPFPLVTADVTALPLAARSVGAVLGCHVLHLIADWQSAVDEACRALRTDGKLLLDFGGPTPVPWFDECTEILARHGIFRTRPGVSAPGPVADFLGRRAKLRSLPPIDFAVETSLADDLDSWENQRLAWTWPYPADHVRTACRDIRDHFASRGQPVERKVTVPDQIRWWAFDLVG